jgi:hypothetical protein
MGKNSTYDGGHDDEAIIGDVDGRSGMAAMAR